MTVCARGARGALSIGLLVLLGGCMVGPDYQRPDVEMPDAYLEPAPTDPSIANLPWWELFEDAALESLIEEALANNQNLGIAVARIEEAAARLGVARADQFPFIDAAASAGRSSPSDTIGPTGGSRDDYVVGGVARFELDLWGRLRRSTAAARAELLAQEANATNVTITLVAQVARGYFLLLDLDDRLMISRRTLETREEYLDIIRSRFERGVVPELDVNQAEIEAATAQAAVARFEREARIAENALSILVGSPPRAIMRGDRLPAQSLPMDVPVGLPLELLERRPDLQSAEQFLVAETERIGVARALRLPSVTLTGNLGYNSRDLDDLLDGDSQAWSLFGDMFAPIFNSGQLESAEEAQRQRAEQARLDYERVVLDALRDVDDSLIAVRTYRAEHDARERQLNAARNSERLSRARYNGGVVTYLEVLDAQRSLFSAELSESQTRQLYLSSVVSLYRSLGGGWQAQTP